VVLDHAAMRRDAILGAAFRLMLPVGMRPVLRQSAPAEAWPVHSRVAAAVEYKARAVIGGGSVSPGSALQADWTRVIVDPRRGSPISDSTHLDQRKDALNDE
jgi:hypothetical protein